MAIDQSTHLLQRIALISALLLTGTPVSAAYSGLGGDAEAMCIEKAVLCEFMHHVSEINGICKVYKTGHMSRANFYRVMKPIMKQLTAIENYPGRQAIRELDSPYSTCHELKEWKALINDINKMGNR